MQTYPRTLWILGRTGTATGVQWFRGVALANPPLASINCLTRGRNVYIMSVLAHLTGHKSLTVLHPRQLCSMQSLSRISLSSRILPAVRSYTTTSPFAHRSAGILQDPYWKHLQPWKDVEAEEFLTYEWQVREHTSSCE